MGDVDDGGGGGVGGEDVYSGNAEPMLDSVLDLYSEDEIILIYDSRPSSSPVYTVTDYCPKEIVNDIDLRRLFYSKQLS